MSDKTKDELESEARRLARIHREVAERLTLDDDAEGVSFVGDVALARLNRGAILRKAIPDRHRIGDDSEIAIASRGAAEETLRAVAAVMARQIAGHAMLDAAGEPTARAQ